MEIKRLTRTDEEFYLYMGPVFGSRAIEKKTKDRFYDDAGKVWLVVPGMGAASLLGHTVKNFWAEDEETAAALIQALKAEDDLLDGVLPRTHELVFRSLGFETQAYRNNFIEVYWHEED